MILGYLLAVVAGVFVVPLAHAWASLMERLAGSDCLCRKGAVHPHCPLHGWERKEHA